jgi:hypothetical protein
MARNRTAFRDAERASPKTRLDQSSGNVIPVFFTPSSPKSSSFARLISPDYLAKAKSEQQKIALRQLYLALSRNHLPVKAQVSDFLFDVDDLHLYQNLIAVVFGDNSKTDLLFKGELDVLPLLKFTKYGFRFPILTICGRTLWIAYSKGNLSLTTGRYSNDTVSVINKKYQSAVSMIDDFEHALAIIAERMSITPEAVARRLATVEQNGQQQPQVQTSIAPVPTKLRREAAGTPQPEPASGQLPDNPASKMSAETARVAQEIFGVSAKVPARRYHKTRNGPEFSDVQLKNPDLLSVADKTHNDMKGRVAKGEVLSPEERAAWNKAKRFAYQARKRQQLLGL